MRKICFLLASVLLFSCTRKQQADTLYYNGKVYTVDSSFSVCEAFAVKDGKIIATGTNEEILQFSAAEKTNLDGKYVYPGFYDAHCHFYGYGLDLKKISLYGTNSFRAVMDSVILHRNKRYMGWVFGRGWDQNDWLVEEFPDRRELDSLFPDVPAFLMRVDGHAALVNQIALNLSGIHEDTKIEGGEVEVVRGRLTGILIDNAVDLVKRKIPLPDRAAETEGLLQAQKNCFSVGLTTIADAGLDKDNILLIDSLQKAGALKMGYYAMVSCTPENKEYFFKKGIIKTPLLHVCSFKIYGDGALGSRGACLLSPYSDRPGHHGFLLHNPDSFRVAARDMAEHGFQLNTHCIGDSACRLLLNIYGEALKGRKDARWRIEHAQVLSPADFILFRQYGVIPSVQPTHATSDMYWASARLGSDRIKGAYAYRELKEAAGLLAAGSDFPVEDINPLYGFYAAVVRKDKQNFPPDGFQMENALSREDALKAMTIWAAFSCFEEMEKGSLEPGKNADFIMLNEDLLKAPVEELWKIKIKATYKSGIKVFD